MNLPLKWNYKHSSQTRIKGSSWTAVFRVGQVFSSSVFLLFPFLLEV
jgi:hypothetical protein